MSSGTGLPSRGSGALGIGKTLQREFRGAQGVVAVLFMWA